MFINDGSRTIKTLKHFNDIGRGSCYVLDNISCISEEDDKAFLFGTFFYSEYFVDGCFIECVAADTLDRVCWVEDGASGL